MNTLGRIFGTDSGAGIAWLYVIMTLTMLGIGAVGFCLRALRNAQSLLPDVAAG